MENKEFKNSLKSQMLKITLIPLTLMTAAIVAVSTSIVQKSITDHIKEDLIHDAEVVGFIFDEFYEGEFRVEEKEDGQVDIYKGDQIINGENTLMAKFSKLLRIDVSIFYDDKRLLTTLSDENGNSAMGTKAAAVVKIAAAQNAAAAANAYAFAKYEAARSAAYFFLVLNPYAWPRIF